MLDPCVYFAISFLSACVRSLGKIYATFSRLREFTLHFPTNLVCTKKGRPRGGGGVTLWNSWWRCATRFSKSWPYFRPKKFSDLASKIHTRFQTWPPRNCIMLERQQRVFKIRFEFAYYFFFFIHLELKLPIRSYSPSNTIYTRFQTETAPKPYPLPFGAAHTYMAYISEYPPPRGGRRTKRLVIEPTQSDSKLLLAFSARFFWLI